MDRYVGYRGLESSPVGTAVSSAWRTWDDFEPMARSLFGNFVAVLEAPIALVCREEDVESDSAKLEGFSPTRAREFTAGRLLAKDLLSRRGLAGHQLGIGAHGRPEWPLGVVGTISHSTGQVVVALAGTENVRALGYDIESRFRFPSRLLTHIADSVEIEEACDNEPLDFGCLLFSAKESIFKAQFELTRSMIPFDAVGVAVDRSSKSFTGSLRRDVLPLPRGFLFRGKYEIGKFKLSTAVEIDSADEQFGDRALRRPR